MRSKDFKAIEQLKNHMQIGRNRKVTVTPRKIRFWWGIINRAVFNSELPVPEFKIRKLRNTWGECWPLGDERVRITINNEITDRDLFMGTLVHEIVHLWQYHNRMRLGHSESYMKWVRYFKRHYGITL